jgi:uncharacterized protein
LTTTTAAEPGPLTPDDFDALDDALDRMREHAEEIPQWEFCEGFLAALVCMRREVPPDEYWPVLLGDDFKPMEHMEFVWRWRRRWEEIATALEQPVELLEDERTYHPEALDTRGAILSLPAEERGDADLEQVPAYGQVWALGFMYAVESWPADWQSPRDGEAPPSVSDERLNDFAAAIWAVYELRQMWKSLGPRVDPLRKAPEPGRNDPCPCGSGKKYTKCHGAG